MYVLLNLLLSIDSPYPLIDPDSQIRKEFFL